MTEPDNTIQTTSNNIAGQYTYNSLSQSMAYGAMDLQSQGFGSGFSLDTLPLEEMEAKYTSTPEMAQYKDYKEVPFSVYEQYGLPLTKVQASTTPDYSSMEYSTGEESGMTPEIEAFIKAMSPNVYEAYMLATD